MSVQFVLAISLLCAAQVNKPSGPAPDTKPTAKTPSANHPATQQPPANPPAAKPAAPAPAPTPSPKTESDKALADWLVNLARHQGHLVGRTDPRSASLHVLALLEAAVSASPDCAEADYWLYDLYFRMGQTDDARKALAQYVRLSPDDDAAALRLLELDLADRQTAETRMEYLKEQLKRTGLSRVYESELYRNLAKHHFERHESEVAATEVEQAIRLNPMNVLARQLAYEMFGETEPALQRVEMALQLIAMNPTQANLVWDLAEFLDRLSLHSYAQEWYQRALSVHEAAGAGPVPAEFWQKLALSYVSSGDFAKARQAADQALELDAAFHSARLLRANTETKLRLSEEADADLQFVSKAYEARVDEVVNKKLTTEAAEIAWFYCYHRPNKARALQLAKIAMADASPSSLARLTYGYALHLNGQLDEAKAALEPLAGADQLAALELAKIYIERGNKGQALTILSKAATIQYSGIAYQLIADQLKKLNETAPQPPLHTKVVAAIDKFPRDIFDYYRRPQDFLQFTMQLADDPLPPTGPFNVTFKLENVGPFAITFGEGFMARPLVAVSAAVAAPKAEPAPPSTREGAAAAGAKASEGAGPAVEPTPPPAETAAATFDEYLQVMMNSRTMLQPGESIEKTVAIDVGAFREHLVRNITQTLKVELNAVFDPVYDNGKMTVGTGTIKAAPLRIIRRGLAASPPAIDALLARACSADAAERANVAEILGALRADAEDHPQDPRLKDLPMDAINAAMAALLTDAQWAVQARATVAVGWAKLDPRVTNAAAGGVRGTAHPIVKLLAVRLFAQHHGDKFAQVLKQLSKTDPSPFVRTMAESYLPRRPRVAANQEGTEGDAATP